MLEGKSILIKFAKASLAFSAATARIRGDVSRKTELFGVKPMS